MGDDMSENHVAKYYFFTGQEFATPEEAKERIHMHAVESRRNLRLVKNDGLRIRAICDSQIPVFT